MQVVDFPHIPKGKLNGKLDMLTMPRLHLRAIAQRPLTE
jgi:hypothetical protein